MGHDRKKTVGSRAEVWHGTAKKTSGGLKRDNLKKNKHGRIVSKRKSNSGSLKRLKKAGYGTKKGQFGWVKIGETSASKTKKKKQTRKGKKKKGKKKR